MEVFEEFVIPFVGLKEGKHEFSFSIDDKFFKYFEFDDINEVDLIGKLFLNKKPNFLDLNLQAFGNVTLSCDVSTELFEQKIDASFDMIVKFGSYSENITEEVLVIPEGSYKINVAQYFFEMIVLDLPIKRLHPGIKDGTLKSEIIDKLKKLEPKENKLDGQRDPRWDKLKDLL